MNMTPQELLQSGQDALNRGDFDKAVADFTQLTRIAPQAATAWLGRSAAYYGAGDYPRSLAAAKRGRELAPQDHRALLVLGPAAFVNADAQTIDDCRGALSGLPRETALSIAQFWVKRLTEKDYFNEAALGFEAFAHHYLDDVVVALDLAHCYLNAFRIDEAVAVLDGLVAGGVADARIDALYARVFVTKGEIAKAKAAALRAVALDESCIAGYVMLGEIAPEEISADADARISALIENGRFSSENMVVGLIALGRARESRKDFAGAFAAFEKANAEASASLAQSGLVYDRRAREAEIRRTIALYPSPFAPPSGSPKPPAKVFIIGMPRSGSTLIDQALSRHSAIASVGESRIIPSIAMSIAGVVQADRRSPREAARDFRDGYAKAYRDAAGGARVVVDKNLFNFEHCGLIADLDPDARFIVAMRDPGDIALSIFKIKFLAAMPWSNDLRDIAHMQASFETLIEHWRRIIGDRMLIVSHEELISGFEPGIRKMLEFCGLDFEPRCLSFHEDDRSVFTTSAAQVRRPVNTDGVERWRRYKKQLTPYFESLAAFRGEFALK
ncbi:MAG TPA: sulfotransferase [Parvularculaceae bacterium]|nr:sulfotransferase [Parvularculaceae bacterium]